MRFIGGILPIIKEFLFISEQLPLNVIICYIL
jgi:hypothetical protein